MAIPGYLFGGDTGIKSPEDLARARAIAEALLMPQRPAQNVGEGLAVLGQAIRGRREMNAANAAGAAGDASASSAIAQALGGGVFPTAPGGGASPSAAAPDGSLPAVDVSKSASGSVDPQTLYAGLKARGLNDAQTYATLGNWKQESEFRPGAVNPGEGAVGFTQWREGRKSSLENFAKATGRSANDPETQMDFYVREAGIVPDKTGTVVVDPGGAAFAKATDVQGANRALKGFIRYGSPYDQGGEGTRLANALAYQKRFGSQGGGVAAALAGAPQGQQVASLDPSAGMPAAPSPVAAALQLPQQGPIPQDRPDIAAALNGAPAGGPTPLPDAQFNNRFAGLPMMGGPAGPVSAPVSTAPDAPPLPSRQIGPDPMAPAPQAAQAQQPAPDNLPVMAGGSADAVQPGNGGPSVQQLMQAAQNPWLKPEQRQLINGLLAQKMKQQDPATLLEMEKNRLDMEKTRIETERLRNPQMSPAEKARLDLDTQKFQADQKKLMELSPGTTVFDPATRAPVYSAPEKSDVLSPEALAQKLQLSKAGASSVNVDTKGETKYDQTLGEELAKKTVGIMDAGQQAPNKIATYQQMMDVLPSIYTGAGGDSLLTAKRALKGLGVDTGDLSGQEFVQAMGNQMALELRNPAGGAGMPGAMSDSDRAFLSSMSPGLSKTPEGNQKLLQYRMALEKRNMEVAHQANEYMNAHGGRLDNNFFSGLADWSNANPLFPKAQPAAAPGTVGAPKSGAVEDGYRFKGGDPADQKNWEPVQ